MSDPQTPATVVRSSTSPVPGTGTFSTVTSSIDLTST
jgi:hypothetical protein